MARMGQFSGATEQYGQPLSFVHPADNDFAKARFNPLLLDPRADLTAKQRRRLQEEIMQLYRTMLYARDYWEPDAKRRR